jgi:hypothetical protein
MNGNGKIREKNTRIPGDICFDDEIRMVFSSPPNVGGEPRRDSGVVFHRLVSTSV